MKRQLILYNNPRAPGLTSTPTLVGQSLEMDGTPTRHGLAFAVFPDTPKNAREKQTKKRTEADKLASSAEPQSKQKLSRSWNIGICSVLAADSYPGSIICLSPSEHNHANKLGGTKHLASGSLFHALACQNRTSRPSTTVYGVRIHLSPPIPLSDSEHEEAGRRS